MRHHLRSQICVFLIFFFSSVFLKKDLNCWQSTRLHSCSKDPRSRRGRCMWHGQDSHFRSCFRLPPGLCVNCWAGFRRGFVLFCFEIPADFCVPSVSELVLLPRVPWQRVCPVACASGAPAGGARCVVAGPAAASVGLVEGHCMALFL